MWNLKICQDAPNQGQDDLVLFEISGFLWIFQGFLQDFRAFVLGIFWVLLKNEDFFLLGVILVENIIWLWIQAIISSELSYVIPKAKATVFHKWWTPKTNENSDKFVYFEFGVFWRGNVSFCGTLYPTGIFHRSVDVWWSALYTIPLQSRSFCLHINSDVDNYCCGPICCYHLSIPGSNAGKRWLMYFHSNSTTSLSLLLWDTNHHLRGKKL